MHDKLALEHPVTTTGRFGSMPRALPFFNLDSGSPEPSAFAISFITTASEVVKDKAALSFILSSSDSESDYDDSNSLLREFIPHAAVVKDKRVGASTVYKATAPNRKGSKFCFIDGCTSRAKHARRCWKHGGSVKCKAPNCTNRAKSKGVCWSHGGGTACSYEQCSTIAVSNNLCWAHGGGKRCQVPTCSKPAYERTLNYCPIHYHDSDMQASEDAMDKGSLSYILSSSDSESDYEASNSLMRDVLQSDSNARQSSTASTTLEAAAFVCKSSKFCLVEGCMSRAKHAKRCWKHGGSVKCKTPNCMNRAKSKGVCWSHGGGTACSYQQCDTIAVSNNLCWAHGGGKRCQVSDCSKPAYERTQNYCQSHYQEFEAA
ncbi:hypothetical protein CCR75_007704 [Bremia lactucae]|uniref:WRKY19-like zinc finger domain-containing protein n=1 Tax=Bremia lactucae TaxID=4779 RepID=A0A976FMD5_BRELC|nr:hypothetical protein CCR75_007704 [Bremia lactucae]